jgi:hypothetical protein
MPVPNTFANATATIPLSQLDANFATTITLGNTAIQLGNTVSTLNNMTLANVTVTSGNVTLTNVTVTTANVTTANIATEIVTTSQTLNYGTANGVVYLNGSKVATTGTALVFDGTNLGVGGTSAGAKLSVNKGASGALLRLTDGTQQSLDISSNAGAGSAGVITYDTVNGGAHAWAVANSQKLFLDNPGNLGLGVTPSAWGVYKAIDILSGGTVFGAATNYAGLGSNCFNNGSGWRYKNTAVAGLYQLETNTHVWYTAGSGTANTAITFTQAMTLDASGNLGIGTSSPAFRLDVREATGTAQLQSTTGTNTVQWSVRNTGGTFYQAIESSTSGNFGVTAYSAVLWHTGNYPMVFATNNAERARITAAGKFAIGNSSASGTLTVDGIDAISTGTASTYAITCGNDSGEALAFGSDGLLAYIQSFGSRPLIINREGNEVRVCGTTDNGAFNLQCNGTGVWGAGAYVNGSDARIKEDVAPIASGLDVVTKLNPVTYRYKESWTKDQSTQTGFIAQELLTALDGQVYVDGVVQQGGSEGYYSVAYQNIIPILTKAIQELKAELDATKAEVALLKGAK